MSVASMDRQRGAALLAMLLVITLGAAWYLTSKLDALSGNLTATNRNHNASVLAQAKQALIGYVANETAATNENDPGAFPCPEAPGNIGGANEGVAAGNCTLPAIGRLPWKTLGIDQLRDANGEPLWYVVADGWAKPSSGTNTVINSNCTDSASAMDCWTKQLTVDGQAQAAIALIIAPGPAMNVQASAGCTARPQARSAPAPSMNYLDYIECSDTATSTFATTASSTSFNDQVVKITAAEALPFIEAAVADRFQRQIAPQLRTAYSTGLWPPAPVLPFAVSFTDPTTSPGNKHQGALGTLQGLLPASYSFAGGCICAPDIPPCVCKPNSQLQRSLEPCATASAPRCDPAFVTWRSTPTITQVSGAALHSYSCTVTGTPSTLTCDINSYATLLDILSGSADKMTFDLDATANNVGMTLRQVSNPTISSRAPQISGIDASYVTSPIGYSVTSATMNNDGSATVRIRARIDVLNDGLLLGALSGLTCDILSFMCYRNTISIPMAIFGDHPLIDPTNATYNWFFRNRWQEVSYYAVAPGIAPSGARSCTDGTTCLQLTHYPSSGKQRALIAIGGPKVGTQVRPALAATDLVEGVNATADVNDPLLKPFALRSPPLAVNRGFNDHFGVIDSNP